VINDLQIAENSSVRSRSNDLYISSKVKGRFVDNKIFSPLHVKVVTENSTVYLLGIVNRKEANEATQIASTTSGVSKVIRVFEYLD
jgi:osmotically-inducible protein OsmY